MKKKGIKLIVSLLCVLALLVGCSNTNVNIKNDEINQAELVENKVLEEYEVAEEIEEEYEYVTVSLLSSAGVEIKTYETIYLDGISYVSIEDLVDLCNRSSDYDQYIENIDISKIDEDIIIVEYNPEATYLRGVEYSSNTNGWSIDKLNEYNNLVKEIDIAETIYGKIEIDEMYYVPINLLQYHIYKGNSSLFIMSQGEICIHNSVDTEGDNHPDVKIADEIDYMKALNQIEALIEIDSPETEIEDYTQYFIERAKMMTKFNDGHYSEFLVIDVSLMDMERIDKAINECFALEYEYLTYKQNRYEKTEDNNHENYVKMIDDHTMYIRIDNFKDTESLIRELKYETKDFKDDEEYNVTVDLRDNKGGFIANGFEFIETIAPGPFKFYTSLVNDDVRIDRIYKFEKDNEKYTNYNINLLVNEYTFSCGVIVAEIIADSFDADIYGMQPAYDNLSALTYLQFPDRSICMVSDMTAEHKTWEELGIVVQDIREYDMIDLESLEANE